ncbi:hypothetical protein [Thalassobacillus sp. B23F22_16]|uniref:hypothetical protein n=1 Tax=Thalassobacillus sp. B23F22_16 TaxID=3459513 RepID=UPI00373F0B9C
MGKAWNLFLGMFVIFALTGCIAEDYDVGVPTAHLSAESHLVAGSQYIQLTEANIDWRSSSGEVEENIGNIEEFGLSQEKINVFPNQEASVEFEENKENGGDIWTDPTITAALWKNGEKTDINWNEYREFQFPANKGNYVLEVTFTTGNKTAQYVGNIVIE